MTVNRYRPAIHTTSVGEVRITFVGGAEGNRTPVRKQLGKSFSGRSLLFAFPFPGGNKHPTGIGSFMMRGMGKAYHTHVLRLNHTRARVSGTPGADGRLIRQPEQQYCCQLNLRNCPFYRGQAPRPAIPASLPPSKPVRPQLEIYVTANRPEDRRAMTAIFT